MPWTPESRARSNAQLRPWKKGESGNPAGRPRTKIEHTLDGALRKRIMTDERAREALVNSIIDGARKGDPRMMKLLAERSGGAAGANLLDQLQAESAKEQNTKTVIVFDEDDDDDEDEDEDEGS